MKKMNRREFLTLTGAALVALSLAGCDDGPYTPPAPPAPPAPTTSKETELLTAINKVWKEKYEAKAVTHEQLTLNQDAVGLIRGYGRVFEKANETPHNVTTDDYAIVMQERGECEAEMVKKYGVDCLAGIAGIYERTSENVATLECVYSCADAAVRDFVGKLLSHPDSSKAEYISFYFPVVQGKTYMTAIVFLNSKP